MSDHQSFRDNGEPDHGRTGSGRGPGQDRSSTPDWYPTPGPWEDKNELDTQQQVDQRYGQSVPGQSTPRVLGNSPQGGQPSNAPYGYGQPGYGAGDRTSSAPGYGAQSYGPQGYAGPGQPTSGYPGTDYGPHGYSGPSQPTSEYPQTGYGPQGYGGPGQPTSGYPGTGYGQAGYGAYGTMPAARSPQQLEADKAARLSMILAIVGLVFPVASIFLGPIAIGQANKAQRLGANATLGRVLGWIATAMGVFWILGTFTSVVFGGLATVFGF